MSNQTIVIGVGEVGGPLLELLCEHQDAVGVDVGTNDRVENCGIMHICFPYDGQRFVAETLRYIQKYRPELTIINSTVAVGTTRQIAQQSHSAVVHSPVRGKHARMKQDLQKYAKFIGAIQKEAGQKASEHFQSIGLRPKLVNSPEASELAKLTETTYFGMLIAWAQEVERYCSKLGVDYDEVVSFYDEIPFFPPVKYFPGVIGGHCVMPNVKLLKQTFESGILDAVERSNELKEKGLGIDEWLDSTQRKLSPAGARPPDKRP